MDHLHLLVARYLGGFLQVHLLGAGDDADEESQLVATQYEGFEQSLDGLPQLLSDMLCPEVVLVDLVGNQVVGDFHLVEQSGCIGFLDILVHILHFKPLLDLLQNVFAVAYHLQRPVQFLRQLLVLIHLPIDGVVAAHAFGGAEEAQGSADRDVETLGEAVHGDFNVCVGSVDGFLCQARKFGSEDQCHGLAEVEVANHGVVLVRKRGHDAVAFRVQIVVCRVYVGVLVVVDPFAAAYGHIAGRVELVAVFDDVNILHPEAVAAAQHGTGVVALVYILEHHGNVARAVLHQSVEELAFVLGIKLGKGFV